MIFRDADACNLCLEMRTSYATMQCNGKLYNVHDIVFLFCDLIFWKTQINCPFERGDNLCNLILSLQISSGTPSEYMSCLIYSLDNFGVTAMEPFNQSTEIPGFVTPFFVV